MSPHTQLENEINSSENLFSFINFFVNSVFSPSAKAGTTRKIIFQLLFFLTWIICAFTFHLPGEIDYPWLDFLYNGKFPITATFINILELFFAWDVILVMGTIYFGYLIALQLVSIYLADIFDIKEQSIAERYIKQSAFSSPDYYQIQIEDARVRPEDQKSPIFNIGGPGKVLINLENAVVFEKINGEPRIVGPSIEKPIELESFERIRRIIDLRDQNASLNISARTFDGISLEIKDIRLLFSIDRSEKNFSLAKPYSFKEESIYWLVYQLGTGPWTAILVDMVRTELTQFINRHRFSELVSAVGSPEVNKQLHFQNKISKKVKYNLAHTRRYKVYRHLDSKFKNNTPLHTPMYFRKKHQKLKRPSKYFLHANQIFESSITRNALSNLFYENITNSFHSKAQKFGMKLEWINVGTWYSKSSVIPDQYISAWKLSNENAAKLHPKVLKTIRDQNRNLFLAKNIQSLPIVSFIQKRETLEDSSMIMNELINEYSSKLWNARDNYFKQKGRVPLQLERALKHLRNYQVNKMKENAAFIGEDKPASSELNKGDTLSDN